MATDGNIQLYNKDKTKRLFPKTKGAVVINNSGDNLGDVEAGAQRNVITSIVVDGVVQTPENGVVSVSTKSSGVYIYQGKVSTYSDLPTSNNRNGDVYDVVDTGKNYAWNGEDWDDIGGDTSMFLKSADAKNTYATKDEVSNGYVTKDNFNSLSSTVSNKADIADTLEGYGITDAYNKEQIDNMLSNLGGDLTYIEIE